MELDDLIFDLIFSEKNEFTIDVGEYINNIYDYNKFTADIRSILKRSKVKIVTETLMLDSKTATWRLKVIK